MTQSVKWFGTIAIGVDGEPGYSEHEVMIDYRCTATPTPQSFYDPGSGPEFEVNAVYEDDGTGKYVKASAALADHVYDLAAGGELDEILWADWKDWRAGLAEEKER